MSAIRRLASRLLRAVVRHSSCDSQYWASAMLRELDFMESDWAALFWALGGTTAIFRHSVPRGLRAYFGKRSHQEEWVILKRIRKNAAGTVSGVVIAVGVLLCAFALVHLSFILFPGSNLERMQWAELLAVIVIPEMIFILGAVTLWRKRRSMAVGFVVSALTLVAHVVVHVTTH
jgi:hypothetical protein